MRGGGCTWQEGMHGGVCMAGVVCMAGDMRGRACMPPTPPGKYDEIRSMSGRYASYWNAFLFSLSFMCH